MVSHSVSLQSVHWQAFWWNSWSIGPWFAQGMDYSIPNSSEVLALAWTTYCTVPLVSLRALLHIHWTLFFIFRISGPSLRATSAIPEEKKNCSILFFIFRMPFQSGTSKKGFIRVGAHGARNTCGSTAEAPCGCWATRCHFPGEVPRRAAQKSCYRSCEKLQVFARNTDIIWYYLIGSFNGSNMFECIGCIGHFVQKTQPMVWDVLAEWQPISKWGQLRLKKLLLQRRDKFILAMA